MKKTLFLLAWFSIQFSLIAGTYTQFSHYSVKEGLSEINVLCMTQDKKGQMWFGTFDGMNKFDGYNFKTYKGNPGQLFGIENYRVDRIKEDYYGYLWIQTYDGRVYRFDPKTEIFLPVPQCNEEFKNYKVSLENIYTLNDGSIWLTGDEDGCFKIMGSGVEQNLSIYHYNTDNELLTSNKVNKIFLDKKKNTWVLTQNGLNLFKRNSSKPVQLFKEKEAGSLFSIMENGNNIWIGGEHGKLRSYNNRKETFDGIMTPCVSKIIDIKSINANEIFILSDKTGFCLYDINKNIFTTFNKTNGSSIKNDESFSLGYGIISTGQNNTGVKSNNFFSSYMDKMHNIWIESDNPSVVYLETAKRKVNNFNIQSVSSSPYATLPNFFVIEDKLGNTWVHPRRGGFSLYNRITNKLEPFYNDPNSPDRKFSNVMHSAYSDRQGNLWLCPYTHGIEKVVFSKSPFNFYKPLPKESTSASNEVRSIFQDKNNWIWVGTKNGTITIFDNTMKLIGELGADGSINSSKPLKASIYNISSDMNGTIWLGSKGDGLYKLERNSAGKSIKFKITNYKYNSDDIYSISSNNVYSIFEDHWHRIWVATYGGGINLLENQDGKVRFISFRNKLKNYPINPCSRTRFITEDSKGRMLVGTTGGMIAFNNNKLRPDDISFSRYSHDTKDSKTISGNDVHYILPAKNGKLYLAIFGGGLNVLNQEFNLKKKPEFKSFMENTGAPSNVIFTLKEDPKGNIWFSTQTGIVKFSPNTEQFDSYYPLNNDTYSFIEATVCYTRQGELAYGTTEGLVMFNPLKANKSNFAPKIILTQLQLFNKTMEVGVTGSPLMNVIDETSILELKHEQNIFSISFAALDYADPLNIQYAYKLEGFEKEWNYVHNQRIATYTNIPKGKYVFRVKSTNAEGVWVNNERSVIIEKLPSFWESIWGTLFYILLFLGLTGLTAYILFTIFRLKTDVEVEHRITNLKLRFFTDISHELRTPLTLIASPVENILRNENLSDSAKEQLSLVQRNTDRMLRLINQILDFRKIQNNKMKLLIEDIHTGSFVSDICQSFSKLAEERNIKFRISDESNNAILWVDKDKFEKIIYNLLSNAFKFTATGNSIEVLVLEVADTVNISVKDSGIGMNKDRLKLLFKRFESMTGQNLSFQQSTGIGLSLTKELVELHHAQIEVESEAGIGSEFKVLFLKGHAHYSDNEEFRIQDSKADDKNIKADESVEEEFIREPVEPVTKEQQTILIVEDNAELRTFLKTVLKNKYEILEAENGIEALVLIKSMIPDLIITDLMMPEMNGLELAKAVKEDIQISHIPLVLLTAKTDMESKLEALQQGADDYITKPFSSAYLEARIENLLKLRKQLQELYRSSITSGVISPTKPNVVSQDDLFIQRIMKYIEENIDKSELTIEDIALYIGFSRSAFFKKLKSLTGLAPIEFLKEVRIQRAAQLIESGEYNFSEITYMVGINDPRYFSRCFKQKFGVSPREYKDKCSDLPVSE
ncbi:MAG: two-component regulator propeller domain-containing protein [Paludibacter sp.]|nr:two-component regulator propeller domain-containing protein [Paludibacter sp.]